MKNDKKYYKERLEIMRKQRSKALKNAFNTIDCFAQPSLDPETYENYEKVKVKLTKIYSKK